LKLHIPVHINNKSNTLCTNLPTHAQDPIRAVVMADRLILIVPDGADSLLSILDKYMKEWVSAEHACFLNVMQCYDINQE